MLSPGVGVGVRVCLARRLWAVALGSHRRTVLRKGWGAALEGRAGVEPCSGSLFTPALLLVPHQAITMHMPASAQHMMSQKPTKNFDLRCVLA